MSSSLTLFGHAEGVSAYQPNVPPWVFVCSWIRVLKGRGNSFLIPQVSFIVFDPVTSQHCPVFVLEGPGLVVLRLIFNVAFHFFNGGLTHRKSPIPGLPMEFGEFGSPGLNPF